MTWAMLVPRKGTEFPWIAKRAVRFIDNEPAIEALAREIGQARQGRKPDCSREAASGRNPVQWDHRPCCGLVAGQARTLKAALEHRMGTRVPPDARILCWLVEFAAHLMNRCDIGSDGKTPRQKLHGRRDNAHILEFGEVMPARGENGDRDSIPECLWEC